MQKILLDTDIGGDIDDAVCLAYLLREPQCALLGVTTVCGESEKRAAGALARWPHRSFERGDAPGFLYRKIRENPHEIVLIGIGNMTNIAALFRDHPDAPGLLRGLFVMNGCFGEAPLPELWYNWNAWADPLAARLVFAAQVPLHRVVPLEVTEQLTLPAREAQALLQPDSPLMRAVYDFGGAWLESAEKLTLHDPLAAAAVFHPELLRFARGFVRVETARRDRMAETAFTPDAGGNVEIARSVDKKNFYALLSSTLNK